MKLRYSRLMTWGAVAAAAALPLAGCSSSGSASTSATSQTLSLGTLVAPTTFAAKDARFANESPYMQAVYDTLLHAKPDGTIVPWLATKWSYNADNTVLTMKLRSDVKFEDGTPFNADAAAQNLLRFRDGTSPQKAYLASIKDATAVDDTTLKITLSAPNPALLDFLSGNAGIMESPKNFDDPKEQTSPDGSGPYVLDPAQTVVGSKYVFTKKKDYWAPGQQHYDKLEMTVYDTPTAMLNAMRGGQINGGPLTDNTQLDQVKAANFTPHGQELNWFGLILFDRDGKLSKPLGNVKVRQAINYAIDREALLKAVGKGYGTATTQVFAPDSDAYDTSLDSYYTHDVAKAKSLMKEAGYGNGGVTIKQPQSPGFPPAAYSLLQQELGEIGIQVKYVQETGATFLPTALAGKYSSMLMQLKAGPTVWESMSNAILPSAGWNALHTKDATVEKYANTIQTGSEQEAASAAKDLNSYLVEQGWFAPWYRPQQTFATDQNTAVELQNGNAYPYLWNITPKG